VGVAGSDVSATVYRYAFEPSEFTPWPRAGGHHVSGRTVRPLHVEPVGELLALHAATGIELRFVPRIGPLVDALRESGVGFSVIRARNALPAE